MIKNHKDDICYPIDFVIINGKYLEKSYKKYKILIVEYTLFAIDDETIYVCSIDNNNFFIEAILIFKEKDYFNNELKLYIENKGGLDNYYNIRYIDWSVDGPERILDSENNYIGDIIKIKKRENFNKNNENIDNESLNSFMLLKNSEQNETNNYLLALFISFYKINKFKNGFNNNIDKNKNKNNINISNIIYNFMIKDIIDINIINDIEKQINNLDENIIKSHSFQKLIDFILDKLHEELNVKQNENENNAKDIYDEKNSYENYKKNFQENNESIISKLFFGIKEIITYYKCCGLKKYNFDIFKYVSFDFENIKQQTYLDDLILKWKNDSTSRNEYCAVCNTKSPASIQKKLCDNPEILIIIINNNKNKNEIKFNQIITTEKYEYNLFCCITESAKNYGKNVYNVIYLEQNESYVIQNGIIPKKMEVNENELILYISLCTFL